METILIQTDTTEEVELIRSFLAQHKIKSHVLTGDDKEDIVLGRLMEETAHDEVVDINAFLKSYVTKGIEKKFTAISPK